MAFIKNVFGFLITLLENKKQKRRQQQLTCSDALEFSSSLGRDAAEPPDWVARLLSTTSGEGEAFVAVPGAIPTLSPVKIATAP